LEASPSPNVRQSTKPSSIHLKPSGPAPWSLLLPCNRIDSHEDSRDREREREREREEGCDMRPSAAMRNALASE
jgi:hypothetical protein